MRWGARGTATARRLERSRPTCLARARSATSLPAVARFAVALVAVTLVAVAMPAATSGARTARATRGATPPADTPGACIVETGEAKSVAKVIDGETIALADGGEVRLIGALSPRAFDAGVAAADWPAEREARDALAALVTGRAVVLAVAGRHGDRWGRRLAQVLVERDGERVWVQAAMIAAGHARAYGLPGSFECADELARREATARNAGLGLWRNPAYAVARAEATRELLRRRNTYQIVEGTVAVVANVRGHVYLNFGADWRDDFTAGIATAHKDRDWLEELRGLTGRRVRVRGWIERQNGPFIAVSDRSQIEILDAAPSTAAAPAEATETTAPDGQR